ncbi:transposase [Patescibacteria group bacterium]|nr:transposase [Patescibacteria group bacterium]
MDFYHIYNRGVDKRDVFLDDHDRARFIHDLFAFNDHSFALHPKAPDRREETHARKLLVTIHSFCLMPNHFHLLLSPRVENGIALFMKKVSMGYARYFNERYDRSGALWQGKYKRVLIERDAHFIYIPYYIHLNPLDLAYPEWREGEVKDVLSALKYLEEYRWSSHLDYLGIRNFPSVSHREFLTPMIGSRGAYENEIENLISKTDLAGLSSLVD